VIVELLPPQTGRAFDAMRELVVVLRYYADLGEQQIAEALQIPPGTVKSRLSRALVRLSNDADLADLHGGSQR
jgi:DNA-directed RNA polymerase specialized sigma24 family protein